MNELKLWKLMTDVVTEWYAASDVDACLKVLNETDATLCEEVTRDMFTEYNEEAARKVMVGVDDDDRKIVDLWTLFTECTFPSVVASSEY